MTCNAIYWQKARTKSKTSVAQTASQGTVYAKVLNLQCDDHSVSLFVLKHEYFIVFFNFSGLHRSYDFSLYYMWSQHATFRIKCGAYTGWAKVSWQWKHTGWETSLYIGSIYRVCISQLTLEACTEWAETSWQWKHTQGEQRSLTLEAYTVRKNAWHRKHTQSEQNVFKHWKQHAKHRVSEDFCATLYICICLYTYHLKKNVFLERTYFPSRWRSESLELHKQ
jgi:hypothetical protein